MAANRLTSFDMSFDMPPAAVGEVIWAPWPRSRWAILWDRVRHPLTEPERFEMLPALIMDVDELRRL